MTVAPYLAPPFRPQLVPASAQGRTLAVPGYRQVRGYTCGYACALMVLRYFRPDAVARDLFVRLGTARDGTRQTAIIRELRAAGLAVHPRYDVDHTALRHAIERGKLVIGYDDPAEHWVVLYGYALAPARVFVADSRAGEPCEHRWDRYGPALRGFGIVVSERTRAGATEDARRPDATAWGQLSLPFVDR